MAIRFSLHQRFAIAGTPEECVARVKALEESGVRRIMVTPPEAIYEEMLEKWANEIMPTFSA